MCECEPFILISVVLWQCIMHIVVLLYFTPIYVYIFIQKKDNHVPCIRWKLNFEESVPHDKIHRIVSWYFARRVTVPKEIDLSRV